MKAEKVAARQKQIKKVAAKVSDRQIKKFEGMHGRAKARGASPAALASVDPKNINKEFAAEFATAKAKRILRARPKSTPALKPTDKAAPTTAPSKNTAKRPIGAGKAGSMKRSVYKSGLGKGVLKTLRGTEKAQRKMVANTPKMDIKTYTKTIKTAQRKARAKAT